jgi:hypothetical protein
MATKAKLIHREHGDADDTIHEIVTKSSAKSGIRQTKTGPVPIMKDITKPQSNTVILFY